MQKNIGRVFIISGPSGVGKDTIIKGIMQKLPDLIMVKSYTTRPPRQSDEVRNRVFVSEKEFKEMIEKGELIEWQKVHDKWNYGRKKDDIVRHTVNGKNVIMDVNVDGTLIYKRTLPNVTAFFIKYEEPELFEKRLRANRPELTEQELQIRKKSFTREMTFEKYYDYSIINYEGHPEKAINQILDIIANQTRI